MSTDYLSGALVASLAAGPVFTAPIFVWLGAAQYGLVGVGGGLLATAAVSIMSVPFGFLIALLPNLIGSAMLSWAGERRLWVRSWLFYAITGAVIGSLLAVIYVGEINVGMLHLGLTGTACAALCRRGTRWHD